MSALKVLENTVDWTIYKDHEKREIAFKAGLIWAAETILLAAMDSDMDKETTTRLYLAVRKAAGEE